MEEKVMVSDALNAINAGIKEFGGMIPQTEDQSLRQTLQQMRNEAETCQYELFTLAKSRAYYEPAEKATEEEIKHVKSLVNPIGMQ